jgi:hypothetical protein
MLMPLLTVFDMATIRANFIKPLKLSAIKARSDDFALLVPIFNSTKYLTNIEFLAKYRKHVILCTTTNETPEFMNEINGLAHTYNFRVITSDVGTGVKNPWAIYNKTLLAHDAVLKSTIDMIQEKYVIFIDGDTYVDGDLNALCGAMEENKFDIASVKVLPAKRETVMEHLQGVEYDIAMQARLIYPWLTSGAGMVAHRSVMISIMKNHSLFFNGGDVEIGRLSDMMGYKVGHIPMVFYTDIPSTFSAWMKQRYSWMCGMFRHSIINMDHNLKHPFHFIYYTFIIYFLMPIKIFEMMTKPQMFPIVLLVYMFITYFANWKVRSRWMLLFPFYALFQVIVIIWCGAYRYFKTVSITGNIGKIKMKHNPLGINFFHPDHFFKTTKSYLTIATAIFVICSLAIGTFQVFVFGRQYEPLDMAYAAAASMSRKVEEIGTGVKMNSDIAWGDRVGQVAGASISKDDQSIE